MTKQPSRLADFQIPREAIDRPASRQTEPPAEVPAERQATEPVALPVLPPAVAPAAGPASAAPAALPVPPPVSPRLPPASPVVIASVPLPATEPRKQVGARIRVSVAERLRAYQFYSREEQQDIVERALDEYLRGKGF
jgi:hypothetical protein